jgi:ABC-2 type transport system ATP-binding protein
LDPLVAGQFHDILRELNRAGATVFISSHVLSEVSELCDRFIFIRRGKIVDSLTRDEMLGRTSESLRVKSTPEVLKLLKAHKIKYQVEAGDLEKVFMDYYKEAK